MITGELKNRIDGLWDVFAAGGLVNPLDVIEQVTYLMFIRDLDDTDNLRAKEAVMLGLPHKSIFAEKVKVHITFLPLTKYRTPSCKSVIVYNNTLLTFSLSNKLKILNILNILLFR